VGDSPSAPEESDGSWLWTTTSATKEGSVVLVELGLVERYKAVLEVNEGAASVTDVARRYGVSRQTVHKWLVRYAHHGLAGLVDKSSKPDTCPHQMPPTVEAKVLEMRRAHPQWGPRTILNRLARAGIEPLPSRSAVYRCLVRHVLLEPKPRKRRPSDYKRWERSRPMELWQMDVTLGVRLEDGSRPSIVTGIDDHSRFCVCATVVARATAGPVCEALLGAMERHGTPEAILSDNGKVFTGRFGPGKGLVRFDRICQEHGIRHLLTAPGSPTTTGKVERFHKTLKREFLDGKVFASICEAQRAIDGWVHDYNHAREHQSLGNRPPAGRFALARRASDEKLDADPAAATTRVGEKRLLRRVHQNGRIDVLRFTYHVGRHLSGQTVEVFSRDGLLEIFHEGVLVATHARRHLADEEMRLHRAAISASDPAPAGAVVVRKVNGAGSVSFAGTQYRVGNAYRKRQVELTITRDTVQVSLDGKLLRTHPKRHDRGREHGALGNPGGRPDRSNAA
jgi:transposase InsO family protein